MAATETEGDHGFTLLELVIVLAVMTVVVSLAGTTLFSLSRTASRTDSMVAAEQAASSVLAQMARDIRSSHSLNIPSGATPALSVGFQVNQPGGGTSNIEWTYDPTGDTVTRYVQNGVGTFIPSGPRATSVTNGAGGIFSYFFDDGTPLTSNYSSCTARIRITLNIGPAISGTSAFQESQDVALTDQLAALTAPGSGQC